MKKFAVLLLSTILVLGLASVVFAAHLEPKETESGMKLSGEAILRGVYQDNATDFDADGDDTHQVWDQRFRLMLDGLVSDAVQVNTRFTISLGQWNGATTTGGNQITTDWAYVTLNIGPTIYYGRQPANWGNKFLVWGAIKDRFKVVQKSGDLSYGGFLQKDRENDAGDAKGDKDSIAGFVTSKFGAANAGLLVVYTIDDAADTNGATVDVHFDTPAGPAMVAGELAFKSGEVNQSSTEDAPMGLFVAASMPFDAVTASAAFAMAMNEYVADDDFQPTLLFGTGFNNPNSIANFGATQTVGDDSSYAIVLGADYKMSDMTTLGGKFAYAVASSEAESKLMEIDLYMKYALAKNTSFFAGLAYGIPTDMSAADDPVMTLAHMIQVKM